MKLNTKTKHTGSSPRARKSILKLSAQSIFNNNNGKYFQSDLQFRFTVGQKNVLTPLRVHLYVQAYAYFTML